MFWEGFFFYHRNIEYRDNIQPLLRNIDKIIDISGPLRSFWRPFWIYFAS